MHTQMNNRYVIIHLDSTAFILPISYRRPKIGSFMYENILPVPDPSIRFNDNPAYIIEESNNAPT